MNQETENQTEKILSLLDRGVPIEEILKDTSLNPEEVREVFLLIKDVKRAGDDINPDPAFAKSMLQKLELQENVGNEVATPTKSPFWDSIMDGLSVGVFPKMAMSLGVMFLIILAGGVSYPYIVKQTAPSNMSPVQITEQTNDKHSYKNSTIVEDSTEMVKSGTPAVITDIQGATINENLLEKDEILTKLKNIKQTIALHTPDTTDDREGTANDSSENIENAYEIAEQISQTLLTLKASGYDTANIETDFALIYDVVIFNSNTPETDRATLASSATQDQPQTNSEINIFEELQKIVDQEILLLE